ncbi:hypothetical protein SAMN02910317_00423 [Ruminococcaceae bacterium FB2012]|nr:hypothetical protein SAMN02910317_00423 [Ruminococcaceae bacterium FB2012]
MKEVKKVINSTDIKYNILTCGAGLPIPADTAVEVVCGGKTYSCKTHSKTKGRLGGVKQLFADNGFKEGDELTVTWDGGSRVTVSAGGAGGVPEDDVLVGYAADLLAEDDEPEPQISSTEREWFEPEKQKVDLQGVRFFGGVSCDQCPGDPFKVTAAAGANGMQVVFISKEKGELIVFNTLLLLGDKNCEKYTRIPLCYDGCKAPEKYDFMLSGALSSSGTFVWCAGSKVYMTDITSGHTRLVYKKANGLGAVYLITENVYGSTDDGCDYPIFAVEINGSDNSKGFAVNIKGFAVIGYDYTVSERMLPPRSGIKEVAAAGDRKLVLKGEKGIYIFDTRSGELTDAFEFVFDPWMDKIKKTKDREQKLRKEFEQNFIAASITEGKTVFSVWMMQSLFGKNWKADTVTLFDGKGVKSRHCVKKSIDSYCNAYLYRNIYGGEIDVDRGYSLTVKGEGEPVSVIRTNGPGVPQSFRVLYDGLAVWIESGWNLRNLKIADLIHGVVYTIPV